MSFLSVNNLTAGYGKKHILDSVTFETDHAAVTGILGANGSGKTTLLKSICNIIPHFGQCILDGKKLETLSAKQLARFCSYIPQRSGITIDISVLDVVLMGFNPMLRLLQHPGSSMKEKAVKALELTGLSGKENDNYLTLSEGQKQLCILARTLVSDSKLLLLDEPESALDFRYRNRILEVLKKWIVSQDKTALITLHDPNLALRYCDRILLLKDGHITATLNPKIDSIKEMEDALSHIYGKVTLVKCLDSSMDEHLIMIKNKEITL